MLGGQLSSRGPLERGREEVVREHRQLVVLGRPVRRDRIEDVGRFLRVERLVVRGGIPGQHRLRHADRVQLLRVFERTQRLGRVEDDVAVLVLNGAAVAPEDVPHRHVRVDILAQPDADRDLHLRRDLLDLRRGLHEVVVGRRAVLHPDLRPHFLVIVAGIGHPHVGQRELLLGERVVRRAMRELDLLAVLLLERGHDVGQIDDVLLERGRQAEEHVHVVARLRRHLGGGARHDIGEADVVHRDVDATLGAPLLRPRIEPLVVGGHEVAPLQDLQLAVRLRITDEDRGTGRGGDGAHGDELGPSHDELPTGLHHYPPR